MRIFPENIAEISEIPLKEVIEFLKNKCRIPRTVGKVLAKKLLDENYWKETSKNYNLPFTSFNTLQKRMEFCIGKKGEEEEK